VNGSVEGGHRVKSSVTRKHTATESPEAVEEKEKEAEEMTLDEWKMLKQQRKTKPDFKIRRAGEGVDNKQWGDMVALKSRKESEEPKAPKKLAKEIHHPEPDKYESCGFKNGFRGRGRVRSGRGHDNDRQRVPDLGNKLEFPSLGGRPKPADKEQI
jgi:hypothetical protein